MDRIAREDLDKRVDEGFLPHPLAAGSMSSLGAARLPVRSVELSTSKRELLERAASALPEGTLVCVPKLPRRSHAEGLAPIRQLKELGLRPVPHIAARSLESRGELEAFMRAVSASGVDRVLVIGGDAPDPAGPFRDSAAVLASGVLAQAGMRHVDVAGYPDGHPTIPEATLRADLARKVEAADRQGLSLTVITQFSFVPEAVADYCAALATTAPGVPVHAGIVGPTSLHRLLQFARICGVSTSLRAVGKFGLGNLRLVTQADPGRQAGVLDRLRSAGRAGNLAGLHLFTFGGFAEGAEWLRDHSAR